MSFNSYSKALYELSIESNITDEIENQSKSILKALETIKEFNAFIKNPLFKQKALSSSIVKLDNTSKIAKNVISLPIYPYLKNDDIKKIYRELNKYV